MEQKKGTPFSVTCTTENLRYPQGKLDWFKDNCGGNITTGVVRREKFFLELHFFSIKEQDMGTYKCKIKNNVGSQEKSFQLVIVGRYLVHVVLLYH